MRTEPYSSHEASTNMEQASPVSFCLQPAGCVVLVHVYTYFIQLSLKHVVYMLDHIVPIQKSHRVTMQLFF